METTEKSGQQADDTITQDHQRDNIEATENSATYSDEVGMK